MDRRESIKTLALVPLGLLYSAFTVYLGLEVNNGEYKVMGLSSYGDPVYEDIIRTELIDIKPDGTFRLNMSYFSYLHRVQMTNDAFASLFGHPRREPDSDLEDHHFDIAASVQSVTEDVLLALVEDLYEHTDVENLCLAGGVALNSVANGRILREGPFVDVFVQPAAGDDGASYGVATNVFHTIGDHERSTPQSRTEVMNAAYLGPAYEVSRIRDAVASSNVPVTEFEDEDDLLQETATLLADGNVVGLYQGRMEFGPRALGNRSILADPRDEDMQDIVNKKIKFREGFRPFAPTVLADHATDYFDAPRESPYMLYVFDVHEAKRDEIPAVTHTDGTARIQTIDRQDNRTYYDLIDAFNAETGTPVVLNTSLNRRGEPIVNTPQEAIKDFFGMGLDILAVGDFVIEKG
jgi:carbamoyltransferase